MPDNALQALVDAFIEPIQLTWSSQLRLELNRRPQDNPTGPSGPLLGASLAVTGTVNGFALYLFSEPTAQRVADEWGSRPVTPGGAVTAGAVTEIMRLVQSNVNYLISQMGEAVATKVGRVFHCGSSGMTGLETWAGACQLASMVNPSMINDPDEVAVYVDIAKIGERTSNDPDEIMHRAKVATPKSFGAITSPSAILGAAPPMPVKGVDEFEEFDRLAVRELKTRHLVVADEEGRSRAVFRTKDDGSTSVILADSDGRMRAALALSNNGVARVMFIDRYGRRVWVTPPRQGPSAEIKARARRAGRKRVSIHSELASSEISPEEALAQSYLAEIEQQ